LDIITQEERYGQLREGEKVDKKFKCFFFDFQISDPKGGMAEDENIIIIFIHTVPPVILPFKME
jgi:hypothetical protein